ncbi:hypothetical protein C8R43DRAFT_942737 [Mycena crocata]|nr:hypothetical protein C8R43DRAFT_942737 [Mycena crocata]
MSVSALLQSSFADRACPAVSYLLTRDEEGSLRCPHGTCPQRRADSTALQRHLLSDHKEEGVKIVFMKKSDVEANRLRLQARRPPDFPPSAQPEARSFATQAPVSPAISVAAVASPASPSLLRTTTSLPNLKTGAHQGHVTPDLAAATSSSPAARARSVASPVPSHPDPAPRSPLVLVPASDEVPPDAGPSPPRFSAAAKGKSRRTSFDSQGSSDAAPIFTYSADDSDQDGATDDSDYVADIPHGNGKNQEDVVMSSPSPPVAHPAVPNPLASTFTSSQMHAMAAYNLSSQPSQPPSLPGSSAVVDTSPLNLFGLLINTEYGVVICVSHGCCIPPGDVPGHLKLSHSFTASAAQLQQLQLLFAQHCVHVVPQTVSPPPFNSPAFVGVTVHGDGWICRDCPYACRKQKQMAEHWRQRHPANGPTYLSAERGPIQTLFAPLHRRFFAVYYPSAERASSEVVDAYLEQIGNPYRSAGLPVWRVTDTREVPPFERATGWHSHLRPFAASRAEVSNLRALYRLSHHTQRRADGRDRFFHLVPAYVARVGEMLHAFPYYSRRRLHTFPVAASTPAYDHYCTPGTIQKYSRVLEQIVTAVIATFEPECLTPYRFALTAAENAAIASYRVELHAPLGPADEQLASFHKLVAVILLARPPAAEDPVDPLHVPNKFDYPIEGLCALLSLREDGSMQPPQGVTPLLAALKFLIRGTMFYEAWARREQHHNNVDAAVAAVVQENMDVGRDTPFNVVDGYMPLASALVMSASSAPAFLIDYENDGFTHQGITLFMPRVRAGFQAGCDEASELYQQMLSGFTSAVSDIPVSDDWARLDPGYSFVEANKFGQDRRAFLWYLLSLPGFCFFDHAGELHLDGAKFHNFMQKHDRFFGSFMPLVGGTSFSRGSEFSQVSIINFFMARGIYYHAGRIFLVIQRTKVTGITERLYFHPMLLLPRLVPILIHYLWYIRPVVAELVAHFHGREASSVYHTYLWVVAGQRVDAERPNKDLPTPVAYADLLRAWTSRHFKQELGPRLLRQFSVAWQREYAPEPQSLDTFATLSGHSQETREKRYGAHLIPAVSSEFVEQAARSATAYHAALGLVPGVNPPLSMYKQRLLEARIADVTHASVVSARSGASGPPPVPSVDLAVLVREIRELRALLTRAGLAPSGRAEFLSPPVPSSQPTAAIRRPPNSPLPPSSPQRSSDVRPSGTKRARSPASPSPNARPHQRVSTGQSLGAARRPPNSSVGGLPPVAAHRRPDHFSVSGPQSHPPPGPSSGPDVRRTSDTTDWVRDCRRSAGAPDAREVLRSFMKGDPDACFKSREQWALCQYALNRNEHALLIAPTGFGKTLVYWLVAHHYRDRYVVVVCPNVALTNDQVVRARAHGLSTHEWTTANQTIAYGTSLVFVPVEFCVSVQARLILFVVDEAHKGVTDLDYRPVFGHLYTVVRWGVPVLLMSATVPLVMQERLLETFGLPPQRTAVRRLPLLQAHLRLHYIQLSRNTHDPVDFMLAFVALVRTELLAPCAGQAIVFCHSREDVDELAVLLNAAGSHATRSDRHTNETLWRLGHVDILVSTTGNINGVDNPRCICVMFFRSNFGVVTDVQGAGRAGRQGQVGHIFHVGEGEVRRLKDLGDDLQGKEVSRRCADPGVRCRRLPLTEYFNGSALACADIAGAQLCDLCDGEHAMHSMVARALESSRISRVLHHRQPPSQGSRAGDLSRPNTTNLTPAQVAHEFAAKAEQRRVKRGILDTHTTLAEGKCMSCWVAFDGLLVDVHRNCFSNCFHGGVRGAAHYDSKTYIQFSRAMKQLPKTNEYCFKCKLPFFIQGHTNRAPVGSVECPNGFQDFIEHVLWAIRYRPVLWQRAVQDPRFSGLHAEMSPVDLGEWATRVQDPVSSYHNGLELYLWLIAIYEARI